MYPYAPPQIAALANRFNPQPMNDGGAPLARQAPPTTSGQIQPAGLQPQPSPAYSGLMDRFNLRPQVAALAQQYNPQFNPLPNVFGSAMSNPNINPSQAQMALQQYQLAQQMQNPNNVQFAQPFAWNNPQPAYNPGFTQAGQAQNNFLTTPTNPVPAVAIPQGGFAPTMLTGSLPTQMSNGGPQPARQFVPGALGMTQRVGTGGGVHGLARYYTR